MLSATPPAMVWAASLCGLACLTLSGCGGGGGGGGGGGDQPGQPEPAMIEAAWEEHRNALVSQDIQAILNGFPESGSKTLYMFEDSNGFAGGPNGSEWQYYGWVSSSGTGYLETVYGPLLTGMTGPPHILDFRLYADATPPMVAFAWNGPGIDFAAEMILWGEDSLVHQHAVHIKKNLAYGVSNADAGAEIRAGEAQGEGLVFWTMDRDWRNGDIDSLMNLYTADSKVLSFYDFSLAGIAEHAGQAQRRAFFGNNPNTPNTPGNQSYVETPTLAVGCRYEDCRRLCSLIHKTNGPLSQPHWGNQIQTQMVVGFNVTDTLTSGISCSTRAAGDQTYLV